MTRTERRIWDIAAVCTVFSAVLLVLTVLAVR
jgi:hypothetical protein